MVRISDLCVPVQVFSSASGRTDHPKLNGVIEVAVVPKCKPLRWMPSPTVSNRDMAGDMRR